MKTTHNEAITELHTVMHLVSVGFSESILHAISTLDKVQRLRKKILACERVGSDGRDSDYVHIDDVLKIVEDLEDK